MQKIKMSRVVTLTFEEGCNKYLENCRQRNLRNGKKKARSRMGESLFVCYVLLAKKISPLSF